MWRTAERLSVIVCLAAGLAPAAQADLRICNDTREVQSVALGYKGATDWTSKGWWNIDPGDCAVVVSGDLTKRYYYYHADSESDDFRGQNYIFCTRDRRFEVVGDTDCGDRGLQETNFREIDTGETAKSFTLTLVAGAGSVGRSAKAPGGGGQDGVPGGGQGDDRPSETVLVEMPEVTLAALESDLPAGQHGRAFTTMAAFQGCELDSGRAYCSFHADGVKLRTFYNGPTPEDMMYALEEMTPGVWAEIEGDAVETSGFERAVVLRAVRPAVDRDPFARLRATVQGTWVSQTDALSEITIRGSEIYVRYEDAFKAARFFQLDDRCKGLRGSGPVLIQTARGESTATCYRISMGRDSLRLEPVSGGAPLRFRKP